MKSIILAAICLAFCSCGEDPKRAKTEEEKNETKIISADYYHSHLQIVEKDGAKFAILISSQGTAICQVFEEKALQVEKH